MDTTNEMDITGRIDKMENLGERYSIENINKIDEFREQMIDYPEYERTVRGIVDITQDMMDNSVGNIRMALAVAEMMRLVREHENAIIAYAIGLGDDTTNKNN